MSDILFALVISVGMFILGSESSKPDIQVSTYNMKVEMRVRHISLEDAGKLETALHEWFSEMSVIQVTIEPDTTN